MLTPGLEEREQRRISLHAIVEDRGRREHERPTIGQDGHHQSAVLGGALELVDRHQRIGRAATEQLEELGTRSLVVSFEEAYPRGELGLELALLRAAALEEMPRLPFIEDLR